jgi:hypothetical protein
LGSSVLFVPGDARYTALRSVRAIFEELSGAVSVCDRYLRSESLEKLEWIPNRCSVRFLYGQYSPANQRGALQGETRAFRAQRQNFEIRIAAEPTKLHDRYLLCEGRLVLLGHGLGNIGEAQSFIVALDKDAAEPVLKSVEMAFDADPARHLGIGWEIAARPPLPGTVRRSRSKS